MTKLPDHIKYLEILRNDPPGSSSEESRLGYQPRLYMSPLSMADLQDIHEYSVVPEFFQHIDVDPSITLEDTRAYISKLLKRVETGYKGGHAMYWAMRLRENDRTVGIFCLIGIDFDKKIAEAGKGLSTFHLGKGHVFEAQWMAINYAFTRLDLDSVSSFTSVDNLPNIQLMKTAGYKKVGSELVTYRDGSKHEMVTYKVNRDEATLDRCLAFARMAQRI